jgi:2-isopropylmalate synthase
MIQSSDGDATWSTVGVSENIIEASFQALIDSMNYKLLKFQNKKEKLTA